MAFLRGTNSELPESQVEYREPSTAKHWLTLILYIILAFAIAVLVVLTARWVYHKVHHVKGTNTSSTTSQSATPQTPAQSSPTPAANQPGASSNNKAATNNSSSSASSNGSSPSSTGSNNQSTNSTAPSSNPQSSTGTTQPKPSSPSQPQQTTTPATLPNNGPGDVAALFAISSLAGTSLHYAIKQRRRSHFKNY